MQDIARQASVFGAWLRAQRKARRLRLVDIHARGGPSPSVISDLENGVGRFQTKIQTLRDIARALGLPEEEVLTRAGVSVPHAQEIFSELGNMRMVALPLWRISCGGLMQLEDRPDAVKRFPADLVPGADAVMIVEGTSMLGLGYQPGDHLFVRMLDGETPPVGSKVVAYVRGGYTCKVYKRDDDGPYLEAVPGDTGPWHVRLGDESRLVAVVLKRLTAD